MIQSDRDAQSLVQAVHAILKGRLLGAQEEAIKKAVADFEVKLRHELASVAMEVSDFYEIRRMENRLVIEVKIDK